MSSSENLWNVWKVWIWSSWKCSIFYCISSQRDLPHSRKSVFPGVEKTQKHWNFSNSFKAKTQNLYARSDSGVFSSFQFDTVGYKSQQFQDAVISFLVFAKKKKETQKMKIFLTLLAFSSARTAKEAGSPNPKSMFQSVSEGLSAVPLQ